MKSLDHNIKKNYLMVFLMNVSFQETIWMLYLAWRGMSLVQIGLLESVFHITGMLMEVPTGFIADRFGRKTSRILSRCIGFISNLIMLSAQSFELFALAFVLTALSYNLESGAGDALVYDSLKECGKEDSFMKVKGRQEIFFQAARLISLIAGGFVASYSYVLAYMLTAVMHIPTLVLACTFREPTLHRANRPTGLLMHIKSSFKAIWESRSVMKYILYFEGFSFLSTTLYFYFQNFLKSKGYIEYQIGFVMAASALLSLVMASMAYKIEKVLGEKRLVVIASVLSAGLFGMIAFTNLEPLAMMLLMGLEGFLFVIFSDYINKRIPSEHRATLLSFEAMIFSTLMIALFPVVGAVAQYSGFKTAFTIIASLSVLLGIILVPLLLFGRGKRKAGSDT